MNGELSMTGDWENENSGMGEEDENSDNGILGGSSDSDKPASDSPAQLDVSSPFFGEKVVVKPQAPEPIKEVAPVVEAAPVPAADEAAAAEDADEAAKQAKPKTKKKKYIELPDRELTDEQKAFPWYVVHTYSGFESRVKISLEERMRQQNLAHLFGGIMVPQETVVELVRGQKKESTRKFFPGYILVQVHLDESTWHLVKDTPKVTGFVGDSRSPSPITKEEVETLTRQLTGGAVKPRPKVNFEEGDAIKVIDGPFADFNGTVDEVKPDKGKLRVLISIFGRNTPVELDFIQVEKV